MSEYNSFLDAKRLIDPATGISGNIETGSHLFDFQRDLVVWALRRGRAAIFADCGMGKTLMELEFAKHVSGRVLIVAPLAVSGQIVREADRFGYTASYTRHPIDSPGIFVTNYEMLEHWDDEPLDGIVLDESSILKSHDGKTRDYIIRTFHHVPFRLACSATPAPNDFMELANHSEFLGAMTRAEMLAMFFTHDGGETQKWRLKGHAGKAFWDWVCSWAMMLSKPSDLGYSDKGFDLPPLKLHHIIADTKYTQDGQLFETEALTLQDQLKARRATVVDRVSACSRIASEAAGPVVVWCHLNSESESLAASIDGSVEVKGADEIAKKEAALLGFAGCNIRVLVTKPSIAGFGMNWQHCSTMIFAGASHSYEETYQAIRRCWRFGQTKEVNVYFVSTHSDGAVTANLQRKEAQALEMKARMLEAMRETNIKTIHEATERTRATYVRRSEKSDSWEMHLGDCVDVLSDMPSDSIHYSVFSPPFASLYTYSNSDRDMGNCKDMDAFMGHYRFAASELLRVIMAGRLISFHCMNLPTSKVNDGFIGIRDFRGELIRIHQDAGWIYHSEVCIWKDPVTAMQRTKALGLLHKQLKKDSCMSRQGIADYVVTMRKPGSNPEPVTHTNGSFPVHVWQRYASPVWTDINPTHTLQAKNAREENDERHICPLQLEVIERCLELWTNPDDLVLSPFAGIGSEGYVALQMGRRFVGVELKESYYVEAVRNLNRAASSQLNLFAGTEAFHD